MTFDIQKYSRMIHEMEDSLSVVWPQGRYTPCLPNSGTHFTLPGHSRPVSVSRAEGRFLFNIVRMLAASNVLEIGTAFGYSALMLGGAVLSNNPHGWLCSVDAQLEGSLGEKGIAFARDWRSRLGLDNVISFTKGFSPNDIPEIIGQRMLDAAFIDGNHRELQPSIDFEAVRPFLKETAFLIWHDVYQGYGVQAAIDLASRQGFTTRIFETSCRIGISSRQSSTLNCAEAALSLAIQESFAH